MSSSMRKTNIVNLRAQWVKKATMFTRLKPTGLHLYNRPKLLRETESTTKNGVQDVRVV